MAVLGNPVLGANRVPVVLAKNALVGAESHFFPAWFGLLHSF